MLSKITFKPGVNRDTTNYAGEGGYFECNKIRFRSGFPQKLGGWLKYSVFALIGTCRQMFNYISSSSDNILALGTNAKLYVETGTNLYNITPLRETNPTYTTPDTDNCIDTTSGSNTISVTITSCSPAAGNYVEISGVTGPVFTTPTTDNCIDVVNGSADVTFNVTGINAVAGTSVIVSGVVGPIGGIPAVDFNKTHQIVTGGANSFVVTVATAATSTVSAAGGVAIIVSSGVLAGIPIEEINGNHLILTDSGGDTFTFEVTTPATSTVSGGGLLIEVSFEISTGPAFNTFGYGWGSGGWGTSTYGTGTLTPINLLQQDWWFDNFDNDLIANIRNGPIYIWALNNAYNTRAVLLSSISGATDVPDEAMQILVSQNDKHLLAFGATPFGGGNFDPLLIRWANQDDPTNWTPTPTNSAGFIRVSRGSRIVRALPTRQEILVWTDSHVYSLQFTGNTDVFALQELSDNISMISPRACTTASNITFWMGLDKFYVYSGRVETLPTTLRNHVFGNFNFDQADQVVCGTNEGWQEVWWFYPSANATTNDSYVVYNYVEQLWYYGTIERTAWLDSPLREYPQAVGGQYIYDHERGVNDDESPMTSFITTNDVDISADGGDGDKLFLIKRIIPDINFAGSTASNPQVMLTMRPRNFPGANYISTNEPDVERTATVPVEQYTDQVFIRARARQMAFKIQSTDLGVQWQLGAPRLDLKPDGRR